MQDFQDKVAVITGAASGIGRALAKHCVQEGAKVVLADVEEPALMETAQALQAQGGTVLPIRTNVAQAEDIQALAIQTLDAFGAVHLLFNNAGVAGLGAGSAVWRSTVQDWEWVLGVNLWGVIHGLQTFVPIMLAQETEGHIVNTASMGGLITSEPSASYQVSKHGVVALSEHLYHTLAQQDAKIKTSVLCPGWVKTDVLNAERNRPPSLHVERPVVGKRAAALAAAQQSMAAGMTPQEVATLVFQAIRKEKFYILTHPELKPMIRQRMEDILQERNPTYFGAN